MVFFRQYEKTLLLKGALMSSLIVRFYSPNYKLKEEFSGNIL